MLLIAYHVSVQCICWPHMYSLHDLGLALNNLGVPEEMDGNAVRSGPGLCKATRSALVGKTEPKMLCLVLLFLECFSNAVHMEEIFLSRYIKLP